jgi:hypothetical protein
MVLVCCHLSKSTVNQCEHEGNKKGGRHFHDNFQGRHNIDTYINKFKDLINMSGYTDHIMIVLKFCRGLDATIQDKIMESVADIPQDDDHHRWYQAAQSQLPSKWRIPLYLMAPHSPADNILLYPVYIDTHPFLCHSSCHPAHLNPCICACPFEAIPPTSVLKHPQGHQLHKDINITTAALLQVWPNRSHQSRLPQTLWHPWYDHWWAE